MRTPIRCGHALNPLTSFQARMGSNALAIRFGNKAPFPASPEGGGSGGAAGSKATSTPALTLNGIEFGGSGSLGQEPHPWPRIVWRGSGDGLLIMIGLKLTEFLPRGAYRIPGPPGTWQCGVTPFGSLMWTARWTRSSPVSPPCTLDIRLVAVSDVFLPRSPDRGGDKHRRAHDLGETDV